MIFRKLGFWIKISRFHIKITATVLLLKPGLRVSAQDVNQALSDANNQVRSYFPIAANLMYACGALVGLIGAVKVYQKWNSGDPDTGRTAAAWFGSCIFLVIVATVIRAFFGI